MPKRKQRKEPDVGTVWTHKRNGKIHTMTVVRVDGRVGFKVAHDVFNSPTAAAKAITKNSVNGWVFWSLDVAKSKS